MEEFRLQKNHLMLAAKNLPQFYELLSRAEKEAQQLHNTLAALSRFEFDIEISAGGQAWSKQKISGNILTSDALGEVNRFLEATDDR